MLSQPGGPGSHHFFRGGESGREGSEGSEGRERGEKGARGERGERKWWGREGKRGEDRGLGRFDWLCTFSVHDHDSL